MFLLEMDDDLRHDVLVMTKEKWEAGHSVPGNEKLDDVILVEVTKRERKRKCVWQIFNMETDHEAMIKFDYMGYQATASLYDADAIE